MSLDARVWQQLEDRGLTEEHLTMLLSLLQTQRNGCFSVHVVHGQLAQCDLRLVFPSRRREIERVRSELFVGEQWPEP